MLKRIASLLAAALLCFSVLPATGSIALGNSTPEELLQQWNQLGVMLHANGYYPFSELEKGDAGYEVDGAANPPGGAWLLQKRNRG